MKKCLVIGMVLLALALLSGTALAGNVYYVATNGNDSNPGTLASPWRTMSASCAKLNAGDTLYARGGTYGLDF